MFRRDVEEKGGNRHRTPRVEILEKNDSIMLSAEMPGVAKEDFDVRIDGDELTISGKRKPVDSKLKLVHGESGEADYLRTFLLSDELDTSNVQAKVGRGILTLTLHKKKEILPQKNSIEVK